MTFSDIMSSMTTTNNAAKRPSMVGYAWRTTDARNGLAALTEDEIDAGGFRLHLVQRDGDQFIYTYDGTTSAFTYEGFVVHGDDAALGTGDVVVGTALPLDAALMTHIVADNWTTGKQSDFESVRVPSGSDEW